MNKIARFVFYFLGILIIGYIYNYFLELFPQIVFKTGLRLFLMTTYPILVGILIGIVAFISRPKADKLKYDWVFALGAGLPLAYLIIQPLLIYANIMLPALPYSFNHPLAGILFGLVIVLAFKNTPEQDKANDEVPLNNHAS